MPGVDDDWPVVAEPFVAMGARGHVPGGPSRVGAGGRRDRRRCRRHEQAKLRILNAAHSALAYWGLLAGHRWIWQAAADPALLAATRDLVTTEVLPTLQSPPGWDLPAYRDRALARFANAALPYATAKVAADGSQKLPVRLLPTVRARLAAGAPAPRCAQLLAAWAACVRGPRAGEFAVADAGLGDGGPPQTEVPAVGALLAQPGFLDPGDPRERAFAAQVVRYAGAMWHGAVRRVLAAHAVAAERS